MKPVALWLVLGAGALSAFSRRSEQAVNPKKIPISPPRRRRPRVTTIEPVDIYGRVPGSARKPLTVIFEIAISGLEKLAVSPGDVRETVLQNANALPGIGDPEVIATEIPRGYVVYMKYPDSERVVTQNEVKLAVEKIDSRLKGRVGNIIIRR